MKMKYKGYTQNEWDMNPSSVMEMDTILTEEKNKRKTKDNYLMKNTQWHAEKEHHRFVLDEEANKIEKDGVLYIGWKISYE